MTQRQQWVLVGVTAVLVAAVIVFFPKPEPSLRDLIARQLGVADAKTLFMNVPPKPERYPGSLLFGPSSIPIELVRRDDADLTRSDPYSLHGAHQVSASAGGGVTSPVFSELIEHSRQLTLGIDVLEGHTVEMPVGRMRQRVDTSSTVRAIVADSTAKPTIIIRPEHVTALDAALREIGPGAASAVVKVMQRPDPEIWKRGAALLSRIPPPPPPAAEELSLAKRLESSDAAVRTWSVAQLSSRDGADVPQLSRALEDEDPAVRYVATRRLANLGASAKPALPALQARLNNPDMIVRSAAFSATHTIKTAMLIQPQLIHPQIAHPN